MKVYALSDFHLSIDKPKPMNIFGSVWDNYLDEIREHCAQLSDDDILLIAGDISWAMNLNETKSDFDFIADLNGKKIIIRGNHDYWWKSISAVRDNLPNGVFALQNDCMKFGNIIVAGSRGWTTPEPGVEFEAEDKKIYEREILRFKLSLTAASQLRQDGDKLVVMIHFPPFNSRYEDTPFTKLFAEFGVDVVVYGHLHGQSVRACRCVEKNGIKYYLSSCDILRNKPIRIL